MQLGGPFVIEAAAQKRSVQRSMPTYHGVLHADFFETYESKYDTENSHSRSSQSLTMKYDITTDKKIAGEHDLADVDGKPQVVTGSFQLKVDSSESGPDYHETYKMDSQGPIAEGGLSIGTEYGGREDFVVHSDPVSRNCRYTNSHGTDDPTKCDHVPMSGVNISSNDPEKRVQVDQDVEILPESKRPADLDDQEYYSERIWYGEVVSGNLASGLSINLNTKKKYDFETTPGDKNSFQKTLSVSIKVTPNLGKTATVPVIGSPFRLDAVNVAEPKKSLLYLG